MSWYDSGRNQCRVYVGNLPPEVRVSDIKELFYKYGKITQVDLKLRSGPTFAFVDFDDPRDAEDAVNGKDGCYFEGWRLKVEFPRGRRPGRLRGRGRNDMLPKSRAPTRSQYRVIVSGLPPSGSWQDLKDHLRQAGEMCYADVDQAGKGVVEFEHFEDMMYAVNKFNDSKFRSHEGEEAYIRLKVDDKARDAEGRNPNRSRGRSHSRSPREDSSSQRRRLPSPRRRSPVARRRPPSPRGHSPFSRRRTPSPRPPSPISRRRPPSPRQRSPSPRRSLSKPRRRPPSPRRSQSRRHSPSRSRSSSNPKRRSRSRGRSQSYKKNSPGPTRTSPANFSTRERDWYRSRSRS